MTERKINEKISAWIGRECTCVTELDSENLVQGIPQYTTYWGGCAMHHLGGLPTPYVTSDRCAIELFPVLLERGYVPALFVAHTAPDQWQCDIAKSSDYDAVARGIQPTIAQAITAALMQLIETI